MNELTRIAGWIYTTLAGSADVLDALDVAEGDDPPIAADVAPADMAHPLITYTMLAALDTPGNATRRVVVDSVWLVRAATVTESWLDLEPIADAIDAALHNAAGSHDGVTVVRCWREEPFSQIEDDTTTPGVRWRHLGGRYRIQAHAT